MIRGLNVTPHNAAPSPAVLAELGLESARLEPAPAGLINRTWIATLASGERRVLQRVNPIFDARVHEDIERVTAHLAAAGLVTPRLVRTRSGGLYVEHDGACWRALTYIDGITRDAPASGGEARSAGALLGRFHAALAGLDVELVAARLGVHDMRRHLAALEQALAEHRGHADYDAVAALAAEIAALAGRLPALPATPERLVHGDPKFSNVVLDRAGAALCLIDLDTLTRMRVPLELGDAMRSWCNPHAEDAPDSAFSIERFRAAIEGYAAGSAGLLTEAEWRAIPAATLTIAVELAARFCADALVERYFAWDASRYPSASAHQRARTRGQLRVAAAVAGSLPGLEAAVASTFEGSAGRA